MLAGARDVTAQSVCISGVVATILITTPITLDGRGVILQKSGVGVISADTCGRLLALAVSEGSTVKTGDVVAQIA